MAAVGPDSVEVVHGSVESLNAYRLALARRLSLLRTNARLSRDEVARSAAVLRDEVERFESGERRPSLPKLIRLCAVFGCDPVELLVSAVADVCPPSGGQALFDGVAEAFMWYGGVTPAQMAGGVLAAPAAGDADVVVNVKGRRDYDPRRLEAAMVLRREYEAGASIRDLVDKHGHSYGHIRKLLIEADTQIRRQARCTRTA